MNTINYPINTLSTSSFINNQVFNYNGDKLGHVKDIMIGLSDGRISYLILSFGGIMGLGDKYFAVPWDVIKIDHRRRCCFIDASKEYLSAAPGFDKELWPEANSIYWREEIHKFYNAMLEAA